MSLFRKNQKVITEALNEIKDITTKTVPKLIYRGEHPNNSSFVNVKSRLIYCFTSKIEEAVDYAKCSPRLLKVLKR